MTWPEIPFRPDYLNPSLALSAPRTTYRFRCAVIEKTAPVSPGPGNFFLESLNDFDRRNHAPFPEAAAISLKHSPGLPLESSVNTPAGPAPPRYVLIITYPGTRALRPNSSRLQWPSTALG
jgi:hypothetical protein